MTNALYTLSDGIFDLVHEWQFRDDAGSDFGRESDYVYMGIFWISTVAFIVLMALMIWFMVAYRRRPGPARVIPRSASHNTPLELFWTIVPTIFLVWMFFAGFWGFADAMVVPSDAVELFVKGRKWAWEVTYPNGATTGLLMTKPESSEGFRPFSQSQRPLDDAKRLGRDDVPVIVVPVNTNVKLRLISEDVLHAFWIPDFRTKIDVIPNRYTQIWFKAHENQIGDHWVFCAEYCGDNHSEMLAVLRVVPMNDYEATIAKWATPENPVEWGKLIWTNTCKSCHTNDGSKGTGPTWKDLFGKTETLRGGQQQPVNEDYVRESILYPSVKIVDGFKNEMQSFQGILNDDQINAIILYMRTLSQHAPQPPAGEAPAGEAPGGEAGGGGGGTDGQKPPTGGGQ